MEWNDIYNRRGQRTGRIHQRGTPWAEGEYGLVVCVWVYDGAGKLLLTRRAKGKSYAGTWENSGGAAKAGENGRRAIARELAEETGILADPKEFVFLAGDRDAHNLYRHYCLKRPSSTPIQLQPGETDDFIWATFAQIHEMIETKQICKIIASQFLRLEPQLARRQNAQNPD